MIEVSEKIEIVNITVNDLTETVNVTVNEVDESVNVTVNETIESIILEVLEIESSITLEVEELGMQGLQGISAYQVALNNGFIGNEREWLESLVPIAGTNGGIIY